MWQGIFTGNQGTVRQVETLDAQHVAAVDNKGDVYKEAWSRFRMRRARSRTPHDTLNEQDRARPMENGSPVA
jgi:hypothetical protein